MGNDMAAGRSVGETGSPSAVNQYLKAGNYLSVKNPILADDFLKLFFLVLSK